jgi:hypothetical protein
LGEIYFVQHFPLVIFSELLLNQKMLPPVEVAGYAERGGNQNSFGQEKEMKRILSAGAVAVTIVAAVSWATSLAEPGKKEIVGLTADQVRWFTPPYYTDGRQRARLFGDSSAGGGGWPSFNDLCVHDSH